jgi:hypothetical protein
MRVAWLILIGGSLLLLAAWQSAPPPPAALAAPIAGPLALSGTFGELRPGHFHGGIDLKGAVGQPVLAAAAGYLERISISAGGYGKALYLRHADGSTTLYAHLDRFRPEVEAWVREMQYARESAELDLRLARGHFAFRQGEPIGYIGMSGRTFGPHLHFELRRGHHLFNPLVAGLAVADRRPPVLQALRLHELRGDHSEYARRPFALRRAGAAYRLLGGDTLYTEAPYAAFSLAAHDLLDAAENRNGIYRLELWADEALLFHFRFDSLDRRQSRYFNGHIDYAAQQEEGLFFNRCWRLPGNAADLYDPGGGILEMRPGQAIRLRFIAYDWAGNSARLEGWLKQRATAAALPPPPFHNYLLPWREASILDEPSLQAYFPEGSFFEDLHLHYTAVPEDSYNLYSLVHQLHEPTVPLRRSFQLAVRPARAIPAELLDKAIIAYCNARGELINSGGQWRDGWLHTQADALGSYCIMLDTVPPRIETLAFDKPLRSGARIAFRLTDNFATTYRVPGLRYRATIDGRWAPFAFDQKNSRLEYRLDAPLAPGRHHLRLEVWDALGNRAVLERGFEYVER